jgi:hypothetical protein
LIAIVPLIAMVPLIAVIGGCGCWFTAFIFGAMAGGDDDDSCDAVGFVVTVCCCVGDDETADVCGGVAADIKYGFTVLGIPHMRDSVVLTTFRLGLLGLHIFALSSGDIGLLRELLVGGDDADNVGEDDC